MVSDFLPELLKYSGSNFSSRKSLFELNVYSLPLEAYKYDPLKQVFGQAISHSDSKVLVR